MSGKHPLDAKLDSLTANGTLTLTPAMEEILIKERNLHFQLQRTRQFQQMYLESPSTTGLDKLRAFIYLAHHPIPPRAERKDCVLFYQNRGLALPQEVAEADAHSGYTAPR